MNQLATSADLAHRPSDAAAKYSMVLDRLFLIGLAGVFLVNAVMAFVHPEDFTNLVAESEVGQALRLDRATWLGPIIAVNDLVLGVAVLAATRAEWLRSSILAWTGLWLLAVTVIKLTALGG